MLSAGGVEKHRPPSDIGPVELEPGEEIRVYG